MGGKVALGAAGYIKVKPLLRTQTAIFAVLRGDFLQQLTALLEFICFLFHLGITLDGFLHSCNVDRLFVAKDKLRDKGLNVRNRGKRDCFFK